MTDAAFKFDAGVVYGEFAPFKERCEARAYLWSIGEYELAEAVDQLQHDADRDGLVKLIGQDAVQQILADAFRPYREAAL